MLDKVLEFYSFYPNFYLNFIILLFYHVIHVISLYVFTSDFSMNFVLPSSCG